jgi:hypothetical protein
LDHIKNLELYRRIVPLLVPEQASFRAFGIRHPDLHPDNVMLSTSPESPGSDRWKIVSLLDWQHAVILPHFLLAGIPGSLQNYDDPWSWSQTLTPPSLPENVVKLEKSDLLKVYERYHARLVHFHYVESTKELNELHHDTLSHPVSLFIRRLFDRASAFWDGETHDLKALLVEAAEEWAELARTDAPCPVEFDPDDVSKTKAFSDRLQVSNATFARCQTMIGFEPGTWVPNEDYRKTKALAELLKLTVLKQIPVGEDRDKAQANWLLYDMNEDDYM